jgi:hypothetical protein
VIEPTAPRASFVAECFWTGVTEGDLRALDARADAAVAELAQGGEQVHYLGSVLMLTDEVVLCLFEGSGAVVRQAAERAGIPFERIIESTPWPPPNLGASVAGAKGVKP